MAVSLYMNRGQNEQPDAIGVGTNAPGSGDVEIRIATTNNPTNQDVILMLEAMIRLLEDTRLDRLTRV